MKEAINKGSKIFLGSEVEKEEVMDILNRIKTLISAIEFD